MARCSTRSPISSARLTLTPLQVADADAMVAVLADARMYDFTGGEPPTLDGAACPLRPLGRRAARPTAPRRGATGSSVPSRRRDPVGVVQATVASDGTTADVAWEIGVPWQGRGYAERGGASRMVAWLAAQGVDTVRALIHPAHVASARGGRTRRPRPDGRPRGRRGRLARPPARGRRVAT